MRMLGNKNERAARIGQKAIAVGECLRDIVLNRAGIGRAKGGYCRSSEGNVIHASADVAVNNDASSRSFNPRVRDFDAFERHRAAYCDFCAKNNGHATIIDLECYAERLRFCGLHPGGARGPEIAIIRGAEYTLWQRGRWRRLARGHRAARNYRDHDCNDQNCFC